MILESIMNNNCNNNNNNKLYDYFSGSNAFSSVSLRNQFMETQIFQDLMSESVFDTPSRCSSADTSLEGSASPFPASHSGDYCTSPDSSTTANNNLQQQQQQHHHRNCEDDENSYNITE